MAMSDESQTSLVVQPPLSAQVQVLALQLAWAPPRVSAARLVSPRLLSLALAVAAWQLALVVARPPWVEGRQSQFPQA